MSSPQVDSIPATDVVKMKAKNDLASVVVNETANTETVSATDTESATVVTEADLTTEVVVTAVAEMIVEETATAALATDIASKVVVTEAEEMTGKTGDVIFNFELITNPFGQYRSHRY
jgi:hypothetical protein